jgi:CubicO group peptidase (beta-lactamase class C family)
MQRKFISTLLRRFTTSLIVASSLLAAPYSRALTEQQKAIAPAMTTSELDAFFSGIMQTQLERNDIAGAVIAVVKDKELIFAKGYGYADVESRTPVHVDSTLFRIGSISKLFTWTAVMQQVEQGKIALDADINQYLDFRIPDAFGKPITMRNLMTHTPGFEERNQGLFVADLAQLDSLQHYLVSHVPARIFAPGTVGAYSNYGAALAGYIVQRVSGEEFNSYVQHHITGPLGMAHTTFAQPLPATLAPLMSGGYELASKQARPYEIIPAAPAGSVAASAADMARFMVAQLQNGTLDATTILKPETAALMQSRQFAFDARENGMCLGFYEESRNGHRIIGHGGDTIYFHSDLHLIPDAHLGVFIAYNSAGNDTLGTRGPLFRKFMDRYFPAANKAHPAIASASVDAREIANYYLSSRRTESNMGYAPFVFGHTSVSADADGSISVEDMNGANGQALRWIETAPGYWEDTGGLQRHLIFKRDANGRWQFSAGFPGMQFQQAGALQNGVRNTFLLAFAIGAFMLSLLLWPVAVFVRKHYGIAPPGKQEQRARIGIRTICCLQTLYWGGGAIILALGGLESLFQPNFDTKLGVIMLFGWIAACSTLPAVWLAYGAWRTQGLWWWTRAHRTLIALAGLIMTAFCLYSHLLSNQVAY